MMEKRFRGFRSRNGLHLSENNYINCAGSCNRKGFTLVELIVVLVILAILAAIAVPVGIGFIERANEKGELQNAAASMTATQTVMNQTYNEGLGRLSGAKRLEAFRLAKAEGVEEDSTFWIQPFKPLADGTTRATEENVASYTIHYAKYTTAGGKVAFYDGREWSLYKSEAEAAQNAKYSEFKADNGAIQIWDKGIAPASDIAYNPGLDPIMPEKYDRDDFAGDINPSDEYINVTLVGGDAVTFVYNGVRSSQFEFTLSNALNLGELFSKITIDCDYQYEKDMCQWEQNSHPVTGNPGLRTVIDYLAANRSDLIAYGENISIVANVPTKKLTIPVNFVAYNPATLSVNYNGNELSTLNWTVDVKTGDVTAPAGYSYSQINVTTANDSMVSAVDGWIQRTATSTGEGESYNYLTGNVVNEEGINAIINSSAAALRTDFNNAHGGNAPTSATPLFFVKQAELTKRVYITNQQGSPNTATFKLTENSDPESKIYIEFVRQELSTVVRLKSSNNPINTSDNLESLGTLNYNFADSIYNIEIENRKSWKWWKAYGCNSEGNREATATCIGNQRYKIGDVTALVINRLFYDTATKDSEYYALVEVNSKNTYALFKMMTQKNASGSTIGDGDGWIEENLNKTIYKKNIKKFTKGSEEAFEQMQAAGKAVNVTAEAGNRGYGILDSKYKNGWETEDVYLWTDNNVIYWYSEADVAYINPDSRYLFKAWAAVTEIDLHDIDFSIMEDFSELFGKCTNLTIISDGAGGNYAIDTSSATGSMQSMFSRCPKLKTINLSKMHTQNITNMRQMFSQNTALTELDLSSFDTTNVENFYQFMTEDNALTKVTLGDNFNCNNATDMQQMFAKCKNLKELDISMFDTRNNPKCNNLFDTCSELQTIIVMDPDKHDGKGFYYIDASHKTIANSSDMFRSCSKLKGQNGTTLSNNGNITNQNGARIDKDGQKGYFTVAE